METSGGRDIVDAITCCNILYSTMTYYSLYIIMNHSSGGRLCTLIGVPWWGVSFSILSTGRFVLKQYIRKGAESAEHAETAGYTYEGTPTTA